jgi:hypothetical protein
MFAKVDDMRVVTEALTALKGPPLPWAGKARTWMEIACREIRKARSRDHYSSYHITEELLRADEGPAPPRPPVLQASGDSTLAGRSGSLQGGRSGTQSDRFNSKKRCKFISDQAECDDNASSDEDEEDSDEPDEDEEDSNVSDNGSNLMQEENDDRQNSAMSPSSEEDESDDESLAVKRQRIQLARAQVAAADNPRARAAAVAAEQEKARARAAAAAEAARVAEEQEKARARAAAAAEAARVAEEQEKARARAAAAAEAARVAEEEEKALEEMRRDQDSAANLATSSGPPNTTARRCIFNACLSDTPFEGLRECGCGNGPHHHFCSVAAGCQADASLCARCLGVPIFEPAAVAESPPAAEAMRLAMEEREAHAGTGAAEEMPRLDGVEVTSAKRKRDKLAKWRHGQIYPINPDGSCLFSAVCFFLDEQWNAQRLRKELMKFMKLNKSLDIGGTSLSKWIRLETGESLKRYTKRMATHTAWGGQVELSMLPKMPALAGLKIHVYSKAPSDEVMFLREHTFKSDQPSSCTAHLLFNGKDHYDALTLVPKHGQATSPTIRYRYDGSFELSSVASIPVASRVQSATMPTPVTIELGDCPRKSRKGVKKAKTAAHKIAEKGMPAEAQTPD